MAPGKEFVGLVPPKEQQPPSDFNRAPAGFSIVRARHMEANACETDLTCSSFATSSASQHGSVSVL